MKSTLILLSALSFALATTGCASSVFDDSDQNTQCSSDATCHKTSEENDANEAAQTLDPELLTGSPVDKQETELRHQLQDTELEVNRHGEKITLILASDLVFKSNGYKLKSAIKPTIDSIAKVMTRYPEAKLIVEGHTDSNGDLRENERLSVSRAHSVRTELTLAGLERARTQMRGFGPHQPVCDNETEEGRACNRRVEMTIIQG